MNKVESINTLIAKDFKIIRLAVKISEMLKKGENTAELEELKEQLNTRLNGTEFTIDEILIFLNGRTKKSIQREGRE